MILEKMKAILASDFGVDSSLMNRDTVFRNEGLGVDSMNFMEYLVFLEKAFDVVIPDEALMPMQTLGDLEDYIKANIK